MKVYSFYTQFVEGFYLERVLYFAKAFSTPVEMIKLSASAGSLKKQESSRKTFISSLLTMPKPLILRITINCGKFWKRWEYQAIWAASWETCMQVRKQQLELDMEQTGSK